MNTRPHHPVAIDHLVIAARHLDEGVAWCEAHLGQTPDAGGRHDNMGTHNRLLNIGSARFPRAYLEIIAIDPEAPPPGRTRWFDLDAAPMRAALAAGPALVHWVGRCADAQAACGALRAAGVERGEVIAAQRQAPTGLLRWQIAVRDDGQRLFDGALPTLIQWGATHPADALPDRGVTLTGLALGGLPEVFEPWLPPTVERTNAHERTGRRPALRATLSTPRGEIVLSSPDLDAASNSAR